MSSFKLPDHLLHPGDILIVSGEGFISTGIKWCTSSKWTHVALYVGGGSQNIIEALGSGVECHELENLYIDRSAIMVRRLPSLTVTQVEKVKDTAYALVAEGYDSGQIISMGLYNLFCKVGIKIPWLVQCDGGEKICTEVICEAFATIGVKFGAVDDLISPSDIADSVHLVTVYEGNIT